MTTTLGITIGAIIGLVALSAFFSGSETALTATSKARMHEMQRRGNRRASIVQRLIDMPERLLGAILLGNNLVNILASALATSLFLELFGASGVVYATLIMTALVLVFGEVMPKTYAIIHPDRFSLFVGPTIRVLVAVLAPIVMGVQFIVKNVMKLFGVDISKATNILSAHDELRGAIDLHHREGTVVKRDRDMLGGILDLRELELSDVMVHRTKMHMIDSALSPAEIIADVLKSGHTRVPIWTNDPDNITGILHAKDLLASLQANKGDASKIDIADTTSTPWFVPDTTPVVDQLNAFLRRKAHFAIVIDEYGEVMGLVTLEDILEEIVGEIADEHDTDVAGVKREASGAFVVDGTTPIRDLNRQYDWDLPDEEATTIAGLVIHEAQIIPDKNQAFTFHGFRFEVLGRRHNQLTSVKITPLPSRARSF
ncbi:MAG: HlyC/CorC family transporter [Rhizobiales bacterium]|nr:HlyC/CorC family transporter [Hyphomicrobiales bacterium]